MGLITFNDGTFTQLRSDRPAPGDRLANWIPMNYRKRTTANATPLADESRIIFSLRTDFGASFELRGIAMGDDSTGSLDRALRLVAWLLNGGTCAVYPEDTPGASYTNCGLWPGSTPTLTQADKRFLEYTLAVQLLNLSGSAMTCHYG